MFVPVDRVPIYELRERVFNNGHKLMRLPKAALPAFAHKEVFSSNLQDERSSQFPDVQISSYHRQALNIQIIDKSTGTKLGEYSPVTFLGTRADDNERGIGTVSCERRTCVCMGVCVCVWVGVRVDIYIARIEKRFTAGIEPKPLSTPRRGTSHLPMQHNNNLDHHLTIIIEYYCTKHT